MRTRKRPPSHPGSILKLHYMEPSEISVTDPAKELKLSRKTVSEILNERGAVTTDVALQCESASNVKVKDLTPIDPNLRRVLRGGNSTVVFRLIIPHQNTLSPFMLNGYSDIIENTTAGIFN